MNQSFKRLLAMTALFTLLLAGTVHAAVVTNADIANLSYSLPTNWSIAMYGDSTELNSVGVLFDGSTTYNDQSQHFLFEKNTGAFLSDTNPITITLDLTNTWQISSFGLANDWGGSTSREIGTMTVSLYDTNHTLLYDLTTTNLNNGGSNLLIDSIFSDESIIGVKSIEIAITEAEIQSNAFEVREFIISGEANPVPVPSSIFLLGFGLMGLAAVKRT